ncbi:M14 family zinc carboxypeptidase [Paenibacillus tarimensis]
MFSLKKLLLIASIFLILPAFLTNGSPSTARQAKSGFVVEPKQLYTYEVMTKDLQTLAARYPHLITLQSIGTSEYGRELWQMDVGSGPAVVLLSGSHHAREWITTILLMAMADYAAQAYDSGLRWNGYLARDLLDQVTFRIVPMLNPDGVTLQQKGLSAFPQEDHAALLEMNGGSSNFKRWKSNAKGIDLNRQYPADWDNIQNPAPGPYYMNYKGSRPLEAKEALAMAEITKISMPELAVAYHSSGEIVYWNFHTPAENVSRDQRIAAQYAEMTGYRMVKPSRNPSGGGYTDWFISEFGRPGLTPELARPAGETNVPLKEWDRIWNRHRDILWMLALEASELWMNGQIPQLVNESVRLTADEAAYQWPSLKSRKLGLLYKGRYMVRREKGGWLEISTADGLRWIPSRSAIRGPFEKPEALKVKVTPDTAVYQSPLAPWPTPMRMTEQDVPVLESWNGWYLIQTWEGGYWIKDED